MRHSSITSLGLFLAVAICGLPAWADDEAAAEYLSLESAQDRFPIHISYYPVTEEMYPNNTKDQAPVVVMLHGTGSSRLFWDVSSRPNTATGKPFAEMVNALGIAVITVDLRKHGESVIEGEDDPLRPVDYPKMVAGDLVAVKRFIFERHQAHELNMNKMGIIAMEMSAPVALAFAAEDWATLPYRDGPGGSFGTPRGQDVRTIILVSPDQVAGRININQSINFLRDPAFGINFMFIAGTEDESDNGIASDLYEIVSAQNAEAAELMEPEIGARGEDLFLNNAARVEPAILTFLEENLETVESQWINRLSRYDQDRED